MKKALIIATCGLALAFIIGSAVTHRAELHDKKSPSRFIINKCKDGVKSGADRDCRGEGAISHEKRSEIFMREIKRKQRVALA